jgi:hypothetical protein
MSRLPKVGQNPPREYFAPIGEIALRHSRLEYQLGVILRLLLGASKPSQYRSIASKRTKTLCSFIDLLLPSPRATSAVNARIKALISATKKIESDRDDLIHSIYGTWSDDPANVPMRFRLLGDASGALKAVPITVQDMQKIADKIRDLQVEAQAITKAYKP